MRKIIFIAILSFQLASINCGDNENEKVIKASGTIESTNVTVSSKSSGEVVLINKDEGDRVSKGDTILIIDHQILDLSLKQAIANQGIAEAQLQLMLIGARQEDIKQAEEMLNQAKANFSLAETDFERMKNLLDSNVISQKQFDDAKTRYDVALAQFNSAKENLDKIKRIARPEEIQQARKNLDKMKSNVELISKNIQDCYVKSPIDGFITKKFVEVGELVSPGSSLIKLSNLQEVELVIYITEVELGKVKLGHKAKINVDAFKEKTFEGKVVYISPEAEFTPKNIQTKDERTKLVFAVKIKIPNTSFELKPGMPADAVIELN
ncbi:MAG: efflux RND transporter periplasmic adaptor subunit [Ignavibacteria bacterium]|nr:efflux RND transporter periplasmic adaptor subunit [Ignavibacteria bacterium]